jgi:anti-sigma factor RsiW
MNDDAISSLRDALLRRDLTPRERQDVRAWLENHPERAESWRADAALAKALRRLPDAQVPSNFTALVMSEIQRAPQQPASLGARWFPRLRAPRFWVPAGAAALVVFGGLFGWSVHQHRQQVELAREIRPLRALAVLPPAILQDFEAIQRFSEMSAPVDYELLAALE